MSTLFDVDAAPAVSKFTHKDLIPIAYSWVLKRGGCGVAFKELNSYAMNGEYPDVLGVSSWANTVLIEVKVSRSDFLADRKKSFRIHPEKGMGTYRFYMCPDGLIKVTELPEKWGLIYVNPKGKARCVHNPYCKSISGNIWANGCEKDIKSEHALMYSALRRLHIKGHIESIYDKQYTYNHKEV